MLIIGGANYATGALSDDGDYMDVLLFFLSLSSLCLLPFLIAKMLDIAKNMDALDEVCSSRPLFSLRSREKEEEQG
jgi:hypothetical protein